MHGNKVNPSMLAKLLISVLFCACNMPRKIKYVVILLPSKASPDKLT